MITILVEGWIGYVHSYSLVNIYQLVSLAKNSQVKLYLREIEPYRETWKYMKDLTGFVLTREEQDLIDKIPRVKVNNTDVEPDLIYRISYPFNIGPGLLTKKGEKIPIVLFYTSEFLSFEDCHFINGTTADFFARSKSCDLLPITPSNWSSLAMLKDKFKPLVIPHGVDIEKYKPIDIEEKKEFRRNLDVPEDAFVFLTVGAMTENKGIKIILRTFYRVTLLKDNVYLILKGIGDLYECANFLKNAAKDLMNAHLIEKEQWKVVKQKIRFVDEMYGYEEMCKMYSASDCYLTPYLAEGFNLPVLEAMSCGLPIICSKGGPTDDFTDQSFTLYPKTMRAETTDKKSLLLVDETSLQEKMLQVMMDENFRKNAVFKARQHAKKFTWDLATQQLQSMGEFVLDGKGTALHLRCGST